MFASGSWGVSTSGSGGVNTTSSRTHPRHTPELHPRHTPPWTCTHLLDSPPILLECILVQSIDGSGGPISFVFMQFSATILPNNQLGHHLWGWRTPPPMGNPASETAVRIFCPQHNQKNSHGEPLRNCIRTSQD